MSEHVNSVTVIVPNSLNAPDVRTQADSTLRQSSPDIYLTSHPTAMT